MTDPVSPEEWRKAALEKRHSERQSQSVIQFGDGRWIMRRDMRTDDGGCLGICTDISQIKKFESRMVRARAESEAAQARLQAAIDALEDDLPAALPRGGDRKERRRHRQREPAALKHFQDVGAEEREVDDEKHKREWRGDVARPFP